MKKFLSRIGNIFLGIFPCFLATKLRLCLHILTGSWQIPPAFPFSQAFANKIPENWQDIFSGTDQKSISEIAEFFRRMETDRLFWSDDKKLRVIAKADFIYSNSIFPPLTDELLKKQRELHLAGGFESLIAHHGVALFPEKIKKSFSDKGIVDAGAFIGSYTISCVKEYNPSVVFSIEPNAKSIRKLKENLTANGISKDKVEIFNCAVGAENKDISFDDSGIRMDVPGDCRVRLTTLDDLLFEKNHPIGLIKADIEGMGAEMLAGAVKIIKRDHPVLALSSYHSPEELFGQYTFLKDNFPFYRLSFTALPPGSGWELTLLAVPEELL